MVLECNSLFTNFERNTEVRALLDHSRFTRLGRHSPTLHLMVMPGSEEQQQQRESESGDYATMGAARRGLVARKRLENVNVGGGRRPFLSPSKEEWKEGKARLTDWRR